MIHTRLLDTAKLNLLNIAERVFEINSTNAMHFLNRVLRGTLYADMAVFLVFAL